jgi:putative intracellular protease/amidase
VLDRAGIAVEFASPLGGKPPEDGFDADDEEQTAFLNSKAYRRLSRSRKLSDVDVLDYDAVFFPGGLGPMVIKVWNAGMIVSAVCHGPSAFLGVALDDGSPLVRGRKLTSFSAAEEVTPRTTCRSTSRPRCAKKVPSTRRQIHGSPSSSSTVG